MQYGTFWQRLAASLLDLLIVLPVGYLTYREYFLTQPSKAATFAMTLFAVSGYLVYTIYLHGRYGQTLGKRALGLRLLDLSGTPITWRQAFIRSSVDLVLAVLACVALAYALSTMSDDWYYTNDSYRRQIGLVVFEPVWLKWTNQLEMLWFVSEFITMLFHPQRRAIHDLMAGTVVVSVRESAAVNFEA